MYDRLLDGLTEPASNSVGRFGRQSVTSHCGACNVLLMA